MDIYGEKVNRLIGELGRLPGIGGKTAQRLAFHIINMPEEQVESLSAAITDAKKNIRYCKSCYTITDQELCPVCASPKRNHKLIMVVETPRDLAAYERVGQYQGVYHVLNGVINPAMGIGTGDIRLKELILRLEQEDVEELIIATNSSVEGEATAMYISKLVKPSGRRRGDDAAVARLLVPARGWKTSRDGRGALLRRALRQPVHGEPLPEHVHRSGQRDPREIARPARRARDRRA